MGITAPDLNIPGENYQRGDVLFVEGSTPDNRMFFVLAGELAVNKTIGGIEEEIDTLKPGTFFGEMGLINAQPRAATIRVKSETARVGVISRDNFVNIARTNPGFLYLLLQKVIERIVRQSDRLELARQQLADISQLKQP